MTKIALTALLSSCAFAVGSIATTAQVPTRPGEISPPNVWVQNRGAEQAIPVTLFEAGQPLRVQISDPVTGRADNGVTARTARQAWEYTQIRVRPTDDVTVALNEAGANGWETTGLQFASKDGTVVVLKRPR